MYGPIWIVAPCKVCSEDESIVWVSMPYSGSVANPEGAADSVMPLHETRNQIVKEASSSRYIKASFLFRYPAIYAFVCLGRASEHAQRLGRAAGDDDEVSRYPITHKENLRRHGETDPRLRQAR